jgi:UDP-N-acetylmuramoyl-tripeptide--D-alanyl-D-alanine ligase
MNLKNDELERYLLALKTFDINANLKGRGEIKKIKDLVIIDESYNAGFDAMISAIENLKNSHFENIKRKIIILGEMRELGIFSNFLHLKLLEPLTDESRSNIDLIILIGADMKALYNQLKLKDIRVFHFDDIDELCLHALKIFQANDLFLIKASNGTSAWRLIEYLENFY